MRTDAMIFLHVFLYIDPGAGSMVIQGLLAVLLAIPFFFRTQAGRVIQRVRDFRGHRNDASPKDD